MGGKLISITFCVLGTNKGQMRCLVSKLRGCNGSKKVPEGIILKKDVVFLKIIVLDDAECDAYKQKEEQNREVSSFNMHSSTVQDGSPVDFTGQLCLSASAVTSQFRTEWWSCLVELDQGKRWPGCLINTSTGILKMPLNSKVYTSSEN